MVQYVCTASKVVDVVKIGQVSGAVGSSAKIVVQYFTEVLTEKANAPPTTANTANDSNIIFILFITKMLFKIKKLNLCKKIIAYSFIVVFGYATVVI